MRKVLNEKKGRKGKQGDATGCERCKNAELAPKLLSLLLNLLI